MPGAAMTNGYSAHPSKTPGKSATGQKVVIVNGTGAMLELLDTVFEVGQYDVVFVESNDRAYSKIRRVRPDLVILCMRSDDLDGFRVLSMLKLDDDTRSIPVLTYTTEAEERDEEEADDDPFDVERLGPRAVEVMH
jgi:CheY-like chemotaxis protein